VKPWQPRRQFLRRNKPGPTDALTDERFWTRRTLWHWRSVLRFVRNARDSGHSCIFIAHNIHHVFQVVDRIVVMRRGRIVADDIDPKRTSIEQVELIITGMEHETTDAAAATG